MTNTSNKGGRTKAKEVDTGSLNVLISVWRHLKLTWIRISRVVDARRRNNSDQTTYSSSMNARLKARKSCFTLSCRYEPS